MGPAFYFGIKGGNINWYLVNTFFILFVIALALTAQKSKRGFLVGTVLTPMTMSDEKKWKQVNRTRSIITYIFFIPMLIVNTVFFVVDKEGRYALTITSIIAVVVLIYFIVLAVYTDILERKWLLEQKKEGHPVSEFKGLFSHISKRRLYTGIVTLIVWLIVLFILNKYILKLF